MERRETGHSRFWSWKSQDLASPSVTRKRGWLVIHNGATNNIQRADLNSGSCLYHMSSHSEHANVLNLPAHSNLRGSFRTSSFTLSRRSQVLNLPVHLHPSAMIDCRNMVPHAGRLGLHCPVEILRLESSSAITRIDLSLESSWLDPNVRLSGVFNRLEVIQLVLITFSQDLMQNRQLLILTTIENIS